MSEQKFLQLKKVLSTHGTGGQTLKDNNFIRIKKQSAFCADLMRRLNDSISQEEEISGRTYAGMNNHYQKRADIRRLRRELMTLAKMLDPWIDN